MDINIVRLGQVDDSALSEIRDLVYQSYSALGEPKGGSVTLNIYESGPAQQFFATHDALEGKPRICIYMDRLNGLPPDVGIAGIRRQVVHSIIHGSLKYYLIKFPVDIRNILDQHAIPYDFGNSLLYSIAMSSKEYEVTCYLHNNGFTLEQWLYSKYILFPNDEEILSWRISSTNRLHKVIYLVALIRDISCAMPLLYDGSKKEELESLISKKTAHLDRESRLKLINVIYRENEFLGTDSFVNIDVMTRMVTKEILLTEFN